MFGKTTSFCRFMLEATFDDAGTCNLQKKCYFYPPFKIPLACIYVFIMDVCTSMMNPTVAFMVALFLGLANFSSTINPERIAFPIFFQLSQYSANPANVSWILLFGFGFLLFLWGVWSHISSQVSNNLGVFNPVCVCVCEGGGEGNFTPPVGFPFQISGQSLIKENCHNSRTSDGIDMKLTPVTKLHKKNKTTSKNLLMTSCPKIVTLLSFFQFMANLEWSGSWIPNAQFVKLVYINSNLLSYKKWKQN